MSAAELIGIGVSAGAALIAVGRSAQALTQVRDEVREMRGTAARTLERVGTAETNIAAILGRLDEQREFSGRVHP